jgi:uncharacterized protein DUF4019
LTNCVASPRSRRLLAALCAAWLAAGAALAQDPRATTVQSAAREWLVFADGGDAQASWAAAGKKFQGAMTVPAWAEALRKARAPLGAMTNRTSVATTFRSKFPGAPEGQYALIVFRSSFAKKAEASETVTLEHESDGKWRVIGYFIR